jgi:hypothetical protein
MDAYPEFDGETDVVFTVHWTLNGTSDVISPLGAPYTGYVYGSVGVTVNPDEPFTPYADLTQDQVLGWVWSSGVDKDAQEANVASQIENQINPTVVMPPLPWLPTLP